MIVNSRGIALILAVLIAVITTSCVSLTPNAQGSTLLVTALVSCLASYLVVFITLEFFFFKEVNRITHMLDELEQGEYETVSAQQRFFNPLKSINKDISTYANIKQREIDELKRLEAFRREFIADISHELKTPIFAAQGFVHTLLDGAVKDKSVRMKFLKKAAKSLDGLDRLVQDLLTISQMEKGEIKMNFEDFDLKMLIDEVFEQMEGKSEKRATTLHYAPNLPETVYVHADYQRIYQVMTNLVSNAIKYTPDNSEVEVDIELQKEVVVVFVKDNGPGIPPEHLRRVFERFYRVEKSRSKDKGGTGLGLAIVKHIIEAHGYSVSVTSAMNKGSVFSFKLPLGQAPVFHDMPLKATPQNEPGSTTPDAEQPNDG